MSEQADVLAELRKITAILDDIKTEIGMAGLGEACDVIRDAAKRLYPDSPFPSPTRRGPVRA